MEKKIEFYMTVGISSDMDGDTNFAVQIGEIVHRFVNNDWGDICESDCELNRKAMKNGGRILGAYNTYRGRVYVITDDTLINPQVTTILYASEY